MASLHCKCGHSTKMTGLSKNELYMMDSILISQIEEKISQNNLSADDLSSIVVEESMEVARCEKCKRIYMHGNENGKTVGRVYVMEEEEFKETED